MDKSHRHIHTNTPFKAGPNDSLLPAHGGMGRLDVIVEGGALHYNQYTGIMDWPSYNQYTGNTGEERKYGLDMV